MNLDLDAITLDKGAHDGPDDGMCVMEAVAMLAGEEWSDAPSCASPVIATFLRSWNDVLPDDERQSLKRYIPLLVGTAASAEVEDRRAWMCLDWLVRVNAPAWLRLAGLTEQADRLAGLPEFVAGMDVPAIRPTIEAVRADARAAWDAAWDAAGDAAWDAAWDAARAAAGDAARAAARDAAWDAAGDAARDAAWDAARAAAGDAAGAALEPTKVELQKSAHALVVRMIELPMGEQRPGGPVDCVRKSHWIGSRVGKTDPGFGHDGGFTNTPCVPYADAADCDPIALCAVTPPAAPASPPPASGERPGGWVEGIGWVAGIDDLDDNDLCARSASELDDPRTATSWRAAWCPRQQPFIVTRWADGTVPAPASPQRPQADGALWGAIRPFLTRFASAYSEDDKTARAHLDVLAQEIAEAAAAALPVRGRADEVVVRGRVCGADSLPIAGHSVEWLNGCVTVDVAFPAPWPKGVAIGGDATVILTQPAAADPGAGEPT